MTVRSCPFYPVLKYCKNGNGARWYQQLWPPIRLCKLHMLYILSLFAGWFGLKSYCTCMQVCALYQHTMQCVLTLNCTQCDVSEHNVVWEFKNVLKCLWRKWMGKTSRTGFRKNGRLYCNSGTKIFVQILSITHTVSEIRPIRSTKMFEHTQQNMLKQLYYSWNKRL